MPSASSSILFSFCWSSVPRSPPKFTGPLVPKERQQKLLEFAYRSSSVRFVANLSSWAASGIAENSSDRNYTGRLIDDNNNGGNGLALLNLMEQRDVQPDCNTYTLLLEGCLKPGSLVIARRIHGKILKLGLHREDAISNRLLDVYLVAGNMVDAVRWFDEMCNRTLASWNRLLVGFLLTKQSHGLMTYFTKLLEEHNEPDPITYATVLRACNECDLSWRFIQQIHGMIIRHGFSNNSLIGNPLIDLYSKKGYIESAYSIFEELHSKDSVTWVAMLSGLSQNDLAENALLLYNRMHQLGVIPTPYMLSSVLSACTKSELFIQGMQIHAQATKWGLFSDTFVSNALIWLYSKYRDMESAENIFDGMHFRDSVTYNSLISAQAQHGNTKSAIYYFKIMQQSEFKPDSVTIASLINACTSIGAIQKGMQLHALVLKSGIFADVIIEGSLLDLYVKCADVEVAYKFFDMTNKDNVVLWNVMLLAYGQMGNLEASLCLFHQMQVAHVDPNPYTYPSIIRTCTTVGAIDIGEQIHALIVKRGYEYNVYVSSVLIDMYSKCGRLSCAKSILNRVKENDVVSWTAMIAGYAQHEFYIEALRTFEMMQIRGIQLDNIGLSSAISACAGMLAIQQGLQIYAQAFILGYSKDLSIGNAVINLYARCGRLREAYSAFDNVETKDEVSWNGLISGFSQSGLCEEALEVFSHMNSEGVKANLYTFGSAVSAAANVADVKQGKQIHSIMIKSGYDHEIEAGNALITLYSKCGSIEDAKLTFSIMPERNQVSWNSMITGYSQHGHGREALKLFDMMKREDFKPNHVTFVGVLSACSHVGLVNEGINYFECMSKLHGIIPRQEHYVCVVDILGRAGQLDRAKRFIEEMPIDPDPMVWRTLLSASKAHKNIQIGEFAARHLLELEPHDSATYVLLSNMYAVAKNWDCRDKVLQMMKDRGVTKEPGSSWIEINNTLHSFFALL